MKLVSPFSQSIVCAFHSPPVINSPALSPVDQTPVSITPGTIILFITNSAAALFLETLVPNLVKNLDIFANPALPTFFVAAISINNGAISVTILEPPSIISLVVLFLPSLPFLQKVDSITCSGTS